MHLNNFSTHRYVINSLGNERLPVFDGATLSLFPFKNQIVSYHSKGYGPRHFQVVDINDLEECVEFYQPLTDQLKGVEEMIKVDENEETFTVCAICQEGAGKMIRIVNSKGELLFSSDPFSYLKMAYDIYDKKIVCHIKILDRLNEDLLMDIYKKDNEWTICYHMMKYSREKPKINEIIIMRSKILLNTDSFYDMMMEKRTRNDRI